jgi:ABC-type polysaccharide/polyol phosphate export permease
MFRRGGTAVGEDDAYLGEHHVYEPHRASLPNLSLYLRELWRRRQFVLELSKTNLKAQHFDTVLGQIWLVLNPLLLALVYFTLTVILSSGGLSSAERFIHLVGGLFAYYFISGSLSAGASSVVGGGKLILNTAFPRALLPLSATITAFYRFLPTLVVFAVMRTVAGNPVSPVLLWTVPIIALMFVFALGLAMLFAALQVYFRDVASFLPYFIRMWLYLSPVLFTVEDMNKRHALHALLPVLKLNPLYYILGSWAEVLDAGNPPPAGFFTIAVLSAVVTFVVGGLFFVSREREFAVRL